MSNYIILVNSYFNLNTENASNLEFAMSEVELRYYLQ